MSTIKTRDSRSASHQRLAVTAAGLAAAVCLMAMSGPIVAGAVAALPGDKAALALRHRVAVTDEGVLAVVAARSRALARYGALEWRRELATASLVPRGGNPVPPERLDRAAAQTRAVLSQSPGMSQDWLRLAQIDLRRGDRKSAASHLSTGLLTGGDMPRTRIMIVDVGFALWQELPGDQKLQVLNALRHEWRARGDRKRLMAQARAAGLTPLVGLALSGEPDFYPVLLRSAD